MNEAFDNKVPTSGNVTQIGIGDAGTKYRSASIEQNFREFSARMSAERQMNFSSTCACISRDVPSRPISWVNYPLILARHCCFAVSIFKPRTDSTLRTLASSPYRSARIPRTPALHTSEQPRAGHRCPLTGRPNSSCAGYLLIVVHSTLSETRSAAFLSVPLALI